MELTKQYLAPGLTETVERFAISAKGSVFQFTYAGTGDLPAESPVEVTVTETAFLLGSTPGSTFIAYVDALIENENLSLVKIKADGSTLGISSTDLFALMGITAGAEKELLCKDIFIRYLKLWDESDGKVNFYYDTRINQFSLTE